METRAWQHRATSLDHRPRRDNLVRFEFNLTRTEIASLYTQISRFAPHTNHFVVFFTPGPVYPIPIEVFPLTVQSAQLFGKLCAFTPISLASSPPQP